MNKRKPSPSDIAQAELAPLVLTIDQVAAMLTVGKTTVYELIRREGLPYVLVGSVKRVPVTSLEWWIEQRVCGMSRPPKEVWAVSTRNMKEHHSIQAPKGRKASPK